MAAALRACVLAAGKGTRMGGDRPKVLFEAGGNPLLEWVLRALSAAGVDDVTVVVGFGKDEVVAALPTGVRWVEQSPQLGTGHAVGCARSSFPDADAPLLVACGDMPLVRGETFARAAALREEAGAACVVVTAPVGPESSFGRVVRGPDGAVLRIVERKDATEAELAVDEGNTGVYAFDAAALWDALGRVSNDNAAGEYYLTDVIEIFLQDGRTVQALRLDDAEEALGVNTPEDLARVEAVLDRRETR